MSNMNNELTKIFIFFFGAGFDRCFGFPNFNELVDKIKDYLVNNYKDKLKSNRMDFENNVKKVHKQFKNNSSLETVMDLFSQIIKKYLPSTSLKKIKDQLKKYISENILEYKNYLNSEQKQKMENFFHYIKMIHLRDNNNKTIIMTTNFSNTLEVLGDIPEKLKIFNLHGINKNMFIFKTDFLNIKYKKYVLNIFGKLIEYITEKKGPKIIKLQFLGYNFEDNLILIQLKTLINNLAKHENIKKIEINILFFNKENEKSSKNNIFEKDIDKYSPFNFKFEDIKNKICEKINEKIIFKALVSNDNLHSFMFNLEKDITNIKLQSNPIPDKKISLDTFKTKNNENIISKISKKCEGCNKSECKC